MSSMSYVFYPVYSEKKYIKEIIHFNKYLSLSYNIKKLELENILIILLQDFCDNMVISYNKNEDKYYCKKYNNNNCELILEIRLCDSNCETMSEIQLHAILYTNKLLKKFIFHLNDKIDIYLNN